MKIIQDIQIVSLDAMGTLIDLKKSPRKSITKFYGAWATILKKSNP